MKKGGGAIYLNFFLKPALCRKLRSWNIHAEYKYFRTIKNYLSLIVNIFGTIDKICSSDIEFLNQK